MKEIGVGLLGLGTVGSGVVEGLRSCGELISQRAGVCFSLKKIAVKHLDKKRALDIDTALLTTDLNEVICDPGVEIVIELIGGVDEAKTSVLKALELGKPVVTANKALLAEQGEVLFQKAITCQCPLFFEASVGGGIPIIQALKQGLVANHIEYLYGILNGTCNYILTKMETEQLGFETVLREATLAGYAEADPSLDIDGLDTAHKAVLLACLSYSSYVPLSSFRIEGVRDLAQCDVKNVVELGYRIKLLVKIKQNKGALEISVRPTLIPKDHPLALVHGVFNAVMISGSLVGETLFYGRGAGKEPTSSAILSDLVEAAHRLQVKGEIQKGLEWKTTPDQVVDAQQIMVRYYLRFSLLNKPGNLSKVTHVLGTHEVSIASVIQKEKVHEEYVPVIVLGHLAKEKQYLEALKEIDQLDVIGAPTVKLAIEDFGFVSSAQDDPPVDSP